MDITACERVGEVLGERTKQVDVFAVTLKLKKGPTGRGEASRCCECDLENWRHRNAMMAARPVLYDIRPTSVLRRDALIMIQLLGVYSI